jgi:hypothetical protein
LGIIKGRNMFKKVFIIISLIILLATGVVLATTWHSNDSQTVAWDAVTTNVDGTPIPASEISYVVYLCDALFDPDHLAPIEQGTTTETQYLLTFTAEGRYFFGVKSVRTVDGDIVGESEIVWSSAPEYDFGLEYYWGPANPTGLRRP